MNATVIEANRQRYALSRWAEGYVDIDAAGRLAMRTSARDGAPQIDLPSLVTEAHRAGLALPVLFRFTDILGDRLDHLCSAFDDAIDRAGYGGRYRAAYPIKVNQQRSVVEALAAGGRDRIGLEAGSKPELLAVLGVVPPGGLIICNGYKDKEYLRLALIAKALGHETWIVIEKLTELDLLLGVAREMDIRPDIGVRLRLASLGTGNWQNTGGEKSKFGLTAGQLIDFLGRLEAAGLKSCLGFLHVHLGSQIPNLRDIRRGMAEAARTYAALRRRGTDVRIVDVGGGLGIDYDGTASRSDCSMNYTANDYASAVVDGLAAVCAEAGLPHPDLVSESGRALTAHHAVLVTNVIDVERPRIDPPPPGDGDDPGPIRALARELERVREGTASEVYREATQLLGEVHDLFGQGRLDLAHRARAERLYRMVLVSLRDRLAAGGGGDLQDELGELTADRMFVNLSVFQSLPDVWALDQIFPIVPIERLDETPDRRAVIRDLTCDSDGRIDLYVDSGGVERSLPVHAVGPGEDYRLGIFLSGAYQEILGDMHNLFGDTDSADVVVEDGVFRLDVTRKGDTAAGLLRYVDYAPEALLAAWTERAGQAPIDANRRAEYLAALSAGLTGRTYLEDLTP